MRARDAAGNIDPTPATRSFAVNTVAPQTTIETGPPEFTNDPTPTFTLASSTPSSTFACALDQAPSAPCTSPHTTEPLQDGPHTLAVRATDPIGNADPTPATSTFTVDTVAPDTLIDEGPPATIHAGPTTFAIRATEQASLQCSLDAAPYGACTTTPNAEDLALGEHVYRARATDRAGNVDATPAEHRFAVTNVAPAATLAAQISGLTVTLAPAATDGDGDPLTYTLDFGDGESTQGTLPAAAGIEHRYAAQGIYTATLHVHDGRTTTTRTHELTLGLVLPTARRRTRAQRPRRIGTLHARRNQGLHDDGDGHDRRQRQPARRGSQRDRDRSPDRSERPSPAATAGQQPTAHHPAAHTERDRHGHDRVQAADRRDRRAPHRRLRQAADLHAHAYRPVDASSSSRYGPRVPENAPVMCVLSRSTNTPPTTG